MSRSENIGKEHCILCTARLESGIELDTGVCSDCGGDHLPTFVVEYKWMDENAEWQTGRYPIKAEDEDEALRLADGSDKTPDSYSSASLRRVARRNTAERDTDSQDLEDDDQ